MFPSDTLLMNQQKPLHDGYAGKYEHPRQKDRETIWKKDIENFVIILLLRHYFLQSRLQRTPDILSEVC